MGNSELKQVCDINNVSLIDAAINKSELGLNPQIDGQLIRLPVPDLSEERRNEMKKIVKSMGEKSKVSVRRKDKKDRFTNEDLEMIFNSRTYIPHIFDNPNNQHKFSFYFIPLV